MFSEAAKAATAYAEQQYKEQQVKDNIPGTLSMQTMQPLYKCGDPSITAFTIKSPQKSSNPGGGAGVSQIIASQVGAGGTAVTEEPKFALPEGSYCPLQPYTTYTLTGEGAKLKNDVIQCDGSSYLIWQAYPNELKSLPNNLDPGLGAGIPEWTFSNISKKNTIYDENGNILTSDKDGRVISITAGGGLTGNINGSGGAESLYVHPKCAVKYK